MKILSLETFKGATLGATFLKKNQDFITIVVP